MIGTYRRSPRRHSARTQEGDLPTHQQFDAIDWRELNARGFGWSKARSHGLSFDFEPSGRTERHGDEGLAAIAFDEQ